MPKVKAQSISGTNTIEVITLDNRTLRVRQNQLDGLTPAEVEAKFNLWVSANLANEDFKAFLHCYSVSPLNVKLMILDKTSPDPIGNWWGNDA